jgi:hypothetical protein
MSRQTALYDLCGQQRSFLGALNTEVSKAKRDNDNHQYKKY